MKPQDLSNLTGLVVTHFDNDHWAGFTELPKRLNPGDVPRNIRLFYPRIPFGVDSGLGPTVMALIASTGPTGLDALAVRTAWSPVSNLVLSPLSKGDFLPLADHTFRALWPPPRLGGETTERLNRLVREIEDLADRLADRDFPRLRNAIAQVYSEGFGAREQAESQEFPAQQEGDLDAFGPELSEEDFQEDEERLHAESDDRLAQYYPEDMREEVRRLARRARRANNDLSLVFHDELANLLIVFGDAPPRVVEQICQELPAREYYALLAPHHGTQNVPQYLPSARVCVAQVGARAHLWERRHLGFHNNWYGSCVATARDGAVTVY